MKRFSYVADNGLWNVDGKVIDNETSESVCFVFTQKEGEMICKALNYYNEREEK